MKENVALGRRDIFYVRDGFVKDDIKAVAFDLDGTLVDSIGQIISCTKSAFAAFNLSAPQDDEIALIIGKRLEEGLGSLLETDKKHMAQELTAKYRQIFIENDKYNRQILFDHTEDLLISLKDKGYKLAIASGRSAVGVRRLMDTTFVGKYIDAFCAGDEVPSKPHPDMVFAIAKRLNLEPSQIVGIGDTDMDIELFQNAKAKSIAVQTGVWSGDAISSIKPDAIVPCVTDIDRIL